MSYIGKIPATGNFVKLDAISVVNGQASYTMQSGSANFTPESANHMLVSLNGVIQAPITSFTVSGSTLTFSSNLVTGDVIDFIMVYGNVLDIGTPSDDTVSTAKLQANAVTTAKITDANITTAKIANDAVDKDKVNLISTSSSAGLEVKGDGTSDGYLQLNCSQNSHGIKLKSPPHSASASYTLTFPNNDGNADQVLTTDGSGVLSFADAGGGTHVLLSTTTVSSGVTSIDFTGLDNTYQSYMVELNGLIVASDNVDLRMRWIQGGSTVTTSNHRSQCVRFGISEGVTNILSTSNASYMRLCAGLGNNSGFTANARMFIYGSQNSASNTQYQSQFSIGHYDNNDEQMHLCHGRIDVSTTTTGFTIFTSTGNMTAGTFRLYGIL